MKTTKALNQNDRWYNRNKNWHLPNTNLPLNESVDWLLCGPWMNIYSILLLRLQNEIRQGRGDRWIQGIFFNMLLNFALLLRVMEVACYSFSLQNDYRGSFSWFCPNSKTLSQIRIQPLKFTFLPVHCSRILSFHAIVKDPSNILNNS